MISGSFSRGSTPTHVFTLPFGGEQVSALRIKYFQGRKEILTKNLEDVDLSGKDISFTLSQEETFLFKEGESVFIQLKIKTIDGLVLNSDIIEMKIDKALDNEVI